MNFAGGEITSNGGVLLLRQAEKLTGLLATVAWQLQDNRQQGKVTHNFVCMLRQRLCAG